MASSSGQFSSCSLALLLLLLLSTVSLSSASDTAPTADRIGGRVGGRTEIKDVKSNKEVQALGKFSVEQYDRNLEKRHDTPAARLSFARVVEAEKQVVAGTKYYLKVVARDGSGAEKVFDAVVVVKPWLKSKELVSFTPSGH